MAGPVQEHHRENHERTDELLNMIRVLLTALEAANDAAPPREFIDQYANAVPGLIQLLLEKMDQVDFARSQEWVGLGGKSALMEAYEQASIAQGGLK